VEGHSIVSDIDIDIFLHRMMADAVHLHPISPRPANTLKKYDDVIDHDATHDKGNRSS